MANLHEHPTTRHPIEIDQTGARTVVRMYGDLDASVAGALAVCIAGLAEGGTVDVVLDLDDVPFCDSSGLGALLGAHRRLGGHLQVCHLSPEVRHVIEERGLDRLLHLT